jgi:arginyl-tRNA synthetase
VTVRSIKAHLAGMVRGALELAVGSQEITLPAPPVDVEIKIERPRDPTHGDWATNLALTLAKQAGMPPRDVALALVARLRPDPHVASVEIAGPGFINFRLADRWLLDVLERIVAEGASYGRAAIEVGESIQVEFVSANPVGPMHVGHGRWAAVGDALARVLEASGAQVQREFYVNDAGTQMDVFGKSVEARYLQGLGVDAPFPEDGYAGHYISEIAAEITLVDGGAYLEMPDAERAAALRDRAYVQVLKHLKATLARFGVTFDVWYSERTLHDSGALGRTVDALREAGYVYESEGEGEPNAEGGRSRPSGGAERGQGTATWFRSTDPRLAEANRVAGGGAAPWPADDRDRVLLRSNGEPTYLCADIAYHKDKFDRGFDRVIDIWGADHHGYVPRMMAAAAALGHPGRLEVIIGQLVNLMRGGVQVRMSKRTGEMVTFEELIDEVGVDAARYFFLMRSTDTALDFDIALAKKKTQENPVYYVQYAHARISSIVRRAAEKGLAPRADADTSLLVTDEELALVKELAHLPDLVALAAAQRAPYKLTGYAEAVAKAFHFFYTKRRVVTADEELSAARLLLCDATRTVLANTLGLLGVSAPEAM